MTDFSTQRVMMVDTQVRPSDVTKFPIIAAMLAVPREEFVPASLRETAYIGESLPLGAGRVLMDARVFAKLLDALDIQPDEQVLDIACGLGYGAAVIARLAGHVVAVEPDSDMAAQASAVLGAHSVSNAVVQNAALTAGVKGLFDVILIEGGVGQVPAAILDNLKDGGRIGAVFMQGALGIAKIGHKSGKDVTWRYAFNASLPVLSGFETVTEFAL
jgi:protein-L-isoaspartate(D-aspartate) O-methyltransferase